ncbi:DM DNA binding domain-containing protein [Ditylenchus destructor]|uniref:DM DNA binding domain-containing protein n=1 Tax=Ditylenchus destructor TaxID=166010 RepID=A0AAD4N372_9BILA|nr:DM DNA binding domain-containing protein [Ditylenchus destructor]
MDPSDISAKDWDSCSKNEDASLQPSTSSGTNKGRVLFCRKCEGHGKQVPLKGHAPICPYNFCKCKSCDKLHAKRMVSFTRRNKDRIEAARALTVQRRAQQIASAAVTNTPNLLSGGNHSPAALPFAVSTQTTDNFVVCTSSGAAFAQPLPSPIQIPLGISNCFSAQIPEGFEIKSPFNSAMSTYDQWLLKCAQQRDIWPSPRMSISPKSVSSSSPQPTSSGIIQRTNLGNQIIGSRKRSPDNIDDKESCPEKRKGIVPVGNSTSPIQPTSSSMAQSKLPSTVYTPFFSLSPRAESLSEKLAKVKKDEDEGWITLPTIPPITIRLRKLSPSDPNPRVEVKGVDPNREKRVQESRNGEKTTVSSSPAPNAAMTEGLNWLKNLNDNGIINSCPISLNRPVNSTQPNSLFLPATLFNLSPIASQPIGQPSVTSTPSPSLTPGFVSKLSDEHVLANLLPQQVTTSQLLRHLEQLHLQQQQQNVQTSTPQVTKIMESSPEISQVPSTPEKKQPEDPLGGLTAYNFTEQMANFLSNSNALLQNSAWQHIF